MTEFSRPVRIDTIGEGARRIEIAADEAERAALARRFGLRSVDRLEAVADLRRTGDRITASGKLSAALVQACVASGEDVPATIYEPFALAFVPEAVAAAEDEVELDESELDILTYAGSAIDLGEAAAQTLALALDPYPRAPNADAALKAAGVKQEGEAGAFGALAGLKARLEK